MKRREILKAVGAGLTTLLVFPFVGEPRAKADGEPGEVEVDVKILTVPSVPQEGVYQLVAHSGQLTWEHRPSGYGF